MYPSDQIEIMVNLNYVNVRIPYTLTGGQTPDGVILESNDGRYTGWYDSDTGSFRIGYDPLSPPTSFNVIDRRTNTIVATIPFTPTPGGPVTPPDTGYGFNLAMPGFIETTMLKYGERPQQFRGIRLDETAIRNGVPVPSKIVILSVENPAGFLQVFAYGVRRDSYVEVYGLNRAFNNTMKPIGKVIAPNDNGWSLIVNNVTGFDTYKVVLVGAAMNPISGASLDLYYEPFQWDPTGGGGIGVIPTTTTNGDDGGGTVPPTSGGGNP